MRRILRSHTESIENGDPYSISISDLMASLLTIFILALSYYMLNYSQKTAVLVENEDKRREILFYLKEKLAAQGIEVQLDEQGGVLRLPEGILFDPGDAEIKESGRRALSVLAPLLKEVLTDPRYRFSVETVFLEGHTDSDPIRSGRFPSNWELSAQRAINTWQTLCQIEPELEGLKNRNEKPFFSISGYADRRPVAPNDTPEGKQLNRRIDLRITMIPPSKTE